MKTVKQVLSLIAFPAVMFAAMLAICAANPVCYVNGQLIFLSDDLVRYVVTRTCMTVCVALAIWLQLKNGRFDFSAGANMILSSIIAGNVGMLTDSPAIFFVTALVCSMVFSALTAAVYIFGRLQTVICTIGMTLFFESITYLVFGGNGMKNFYAKENLSIFGRMPWVLVPALIAVAVFYVFSYHTAAGRKGKILAKNQAAGVNIGINEKTNVFVTYLFTGAILGMAAVIYVSQEQVGAQSGLTTSSVMFSYIVPVYMGMFIGGITVDVLGIISAAVGLQFLNYGLNCMNLGAGGWQQIIFGLFVFCFYSLSGQSGKIVAFIKKLTNKEAAANA